MSTKQSTVDYIVDQLVGVPKVSTRKMFGEYALYVGGKVVGLICDDTLFIKITPEGKEFVSKNSNYKEGSAYPGAKPSIIIDEDMIEDHELISKLVMVTEESLPMPKFKLKSKPKLKKKK